MAKHSSSLPARADRALLGSYEVLGTPKDGVKILKPKGRATHFTDKELREAIATVRSTQKAG